MYTNIYMHIYKSIYLNIYTNIYTFYKISHDQHKEILLKNVTKDYKKAGKDIQIKIHDEEKESATKLKLEDRIYSTVEREAFVSIKDHKKNFENNT